MFSPVTWQTLLVHPLVQFGDEVRHVMEILHIRQPVWLAAELLAPPSEVRPDFGLSFYRRRHRGHDDAFGPAPTSWIIFGLKAVWKLVT